MHSTMLATMNRDIHNCMLGLSNVRTSLRTLGGRLSSTKTLHRQTSTKLRLISTCCCRIRHMHLTKQLLLFTSSCRRLSSINGRFCLRGSGCGASYCMLGGCSPSVHGGMSPSGICALHHNHHSMFVGSCRCPLLYAPSYTSLPTVRMRIRRSVPTHFDRLRRQLDRTRTRYNS